MMQVQQPWVQVTEEAHMTRQSVALVGGPKVTTESLVRWCQMPRGGAFFSCGSTLLYAVRAAKFQ